MTGIVLCGSGVGTFIYAPLATALEESLGWQNTIRILAGVFVICAPLAMTMTQPSAPEKPERDTAVEVKTDKSPTVWSVVRNPYFLLVGLSQCVANIGMSIMFTYLPDVAVLRGFPEAKSNFLLSIVGKLIDLT